MVQFENLDLGRVVVHEVYQRGDNRELRMPTFADGLETLSPEAIGAFRMRMTEALSGQTQTLQMAIKRFGPESFLAAAEKLMSATDEVFLAESRTLANKLAEAQLARRIPGGMLIVFDGRVGYPAVPFVGVIKAETQAGFRRSQSGARAVIEFLQDIFLTPATRLYKIGIVVRTRPEAIGLDGWQAYVFDSNISSSNREAAAAYFYDGFLGCALPSDGAYETQRFFDLTKEFVKKADLEPDKKRDLMDSLFVFVREENSPTFTADQFCDRYVPRQLQDTYTEFLARKRFPPTAVVRDVSQMGSRLRRRRLKFGADIELSASPEALTNKVTIESIPAADSGSEADRWTHIVIRSPLTGEQ